MFKVHVNDGTQEMPTDDICYIVAKEGIFLKKKMGIMDSIAPVDKISILESVSARAKMHIPPIPAALFAKVIDFFGEVYDKYRGESIVLLFYNEETQKYKIIPPSQKVSAGSLEYNRSMTVEGYTMIGDIHSHGSMSAFHSGIDDDDEKSFDGLHITIGNANDDEISLSGSIVANGYRFMVDPMEYVAGIKLTKDEDTKETTYSTKVYKTINGKLILDTEASKPIYTYRKLDKRYVSSVAPSKRKVSESWLDKVERGSYVYTYGYGVGRSGGHAYTGKRFVNGKWIDVNYGNWGSHYDSHAWQKYHKVGDKPPAHTIPPKSVIPIKNKLPSFIQPDKDKQDDIIPCFTCIFREEKLMLEEDDVLEDEFYICEKCGQIISGDSDELTCPDCKTDHHLQLIEDKDLEDNSIDVEEVTEDKTPSPYYNCPQCMAELMVRANDNFCPFCFAYLHYDSETEKENQMETDAGGFLDVEANEANEAALKEVDGVNKIPVPDQEAIPISTKIPHEPAWKTMIKKAFMGK